MSSKEELIKQLENLTKLEMSHKDEPRPNYDEIIIIHKKRMEIWEELGQINQEEQQRKGHI